MAKDYNDTINEILDDVYMPDTYIVGYWLPLQHVLHFNLDYMTANRVASEYIFGLLEDSDIKVHTQEPNSSVIRFDAVSHLWLNVSLDGLSVSLLTSNTNKIAVDNIARVFMDTSIPGRWGPDILSLMRYIKFRIDTGEYPSEK